MYSCRFFPSGVVVLSGGADLKLKIWSIQDGSCARTLTGHKRGKTERLVVFKFIQFHTVINDTAIVERGRNIICKLLELCVYKINIFYVWSSYHVKNTI